MPQLGQHKQDGDVTLWVLGLKRAREEGPCMLRKIVCFHHHTKALSDPQSYVYSNYFLSITRPPLGYANIQN